MAITLSSTFTGNLLEHGGVAVADQIGAGTLVLYGSGGSPPAGPNESATGTLLATFTFSAGTAQGTPSGGAMTLAFAALTVTAAGTATADYFRVKDSSANALIQGSVGTAGADWNLTNTAIATGDNVTITGTPSISWTVT